MSNASGKLTSELSRRTGDAGDDEPLEIVIELGPGSSPLMEHPTMEAMRGAFERDAGALEQAVVAAGGQVLASAWLNRTIRARVPAGALRGLSAIDVVETLDLPRRLHPDRT